MIKDYFTESITIKRKDRVKIDGVMKETLVEVETILVAMDQSVTNYSFQNDKETFSYSDVMFAPIAADVLEDDIVVYGSDDYDVISVMNPMKRQHHLEVLLNMRK